LYRLVHDPSDASFIEIGCVNLLEKGM